MIQLVFASCTTKTVDGQNEVAFGLNNGLPWGRISQDLKNFKARTNNTVLIMGAKTFSSFKDPLPHRMSVVVCDTSRPLPTTISGKKASGYISMDDFEKLLGGEQVLVADATVEYPWKTSLHREYSNISIIGGKGLIEQAITRVDQVVHTSIIKDHRVNSDVQLSLETIFELRARYKLTEHHWYQCDEITQIIESVYIPKDIL